MNRPTPSGTTLLRAAFLTALSAALSVGTVIFGGAPLLAVRRWSSRPIFYGLSALVLVILLVGTGVQVWGPFLLSVLVVAQFAEFEAAGFSRVKAAVVSVIATGVICGIGAARWAQSRGAPIQKLVHEKVEVLASEITRIQPGLSIDVGMVVNQWPSAALIFIALTIWASLVLEPLFHSVLGLTVKADKSRESLRSFAVPDLVLWITLAALVAAFFEFKAGWIKTVGTNALNVMILVHFFQGLAVVATFFRLFRVSAIWQSLAYAVVFSQLFLLVALFGLLDFWIDFRKRMRNKPAQRTGEV